MFGKVIIFVSVILTCKGAEEEPVSIGLGVLSPSYSQKIDGVKVNFEQKGNGFSYSLGEPGSGNSAYHHLGDAAKSVASAQLAPKADQPTYTFTGDSGGQHGPQQYGGGGAAHGANAVGGVSPYHGQGGLYQQGHAGQAGLYQQGHAGQSGLYQQGHGSAFPNLGYSAGQGGYANQAQIAPFVNAHHGGQGAQVGQQGFSHGSPFGQQAFHGHGQQGAGGRFSITHGDGGQSSFYPNVGAFGFGGGQGGAGLGGHGGFQGPAHNIQPNQALGHQGAGQYSPTHGGQGGGYSAGAGLHYGGQNIQGNHGGLGAHQGAYGGAHQGGYGGSQGYGGAGH